MSVMQEDEGMMVLGTDTHQRSHTVTAVAAPTGELVGEQTVQVGRCGFGALLQRARGLDDDRVWALEDCRHVSGSLERFLIATMRVRIARDELRRPRELTLAINQLECEIAALVAQIAPQLLDEPGIGPLIAAELVGEIAGAQRFATPATLARAAGVAPIPASGNTQRRRLDQGGNRQINAALHPIVVTRARCTPRRATPSPAAAAKARALAKRSAASSATSPAASGDCCSHPPDQDISLTLNS